MINQELKEVVANFMCFLAKMADYSTYTGKETVINSDNVHFISGSKDPLLNGICFYRQDEAALLDHVQLLSKKMQEYYIWWPHDALSEATLIELEKYNLLDISTLTCVTAALNELTTYPIPLEIDIQPVNSIESYALFMSIFMEGFKIPQHLYDDYFKMFRFYQHEPQCLYHFIAYYKKQPAGIVSVARQDSIVGMYTGTTLDPFKNKGILNAFFVRMIEIMGQEGALRMVYQSKQPIPLENIKTRFGFRPVGELVAYRMRG